MDDPFSIPPKAHSNTRLYVIIIGLIVILLGVAGYFFWKTISRNVVSTDTITTSTQTTADETTKIQGLQLDPNKQYGNKYANGLLPVGDKLYTTDAAKQGSIYLCRANFVPEGQAGAQTRGPWFVNNNTQWDIHKKSRVQGAVNWQPSMSNQVTGDKRVIGTNGLPSHITGKYPIATTDPAYRYDRNPSTIKSQSLTYSLTANPAYGQPQCMGGEVGVMLTGVALFNAFDAGGRDAGAWEVQDDCDGHPQNKGEYHYHTLSRCIKDVSIQTIIGYALDGFPITGPKVSEGNYLTTSDLDECHGITSDVIVDGKKTKTYHYVMTQDFPYSVSCFRAAPTKAPGLPETTSTRP